MATRRILNRVRQAAKDTVWCELNDHLQRQLNNHHSDIGRVAERILREASRKAANEGSDFAEYESITHLATANGTSRKEVYGALDELQGRAMAKVEHVGRVVRIHPAWDSGQWATRAVYDERLFDSADRNVRLAGDEPQPLPGCEHLFQREIDKQLLKDLMERAVDEQDKTVTAGNTSIGTVAGGNTRTAEADAGVRHVSPPDTNGENRPPERPPEVLPAVTLLAPKAIAVQAQPPIAVTAMHLQEIKQRLLELGPPWDDVQGRELLSLAKTLNNGSFRARKRDGTVGNYEPQWKRWVRMNPEHVQAALCRAVNEEREGKCTSTVLSLAAQIARELFGEAEP